MAKAAKDGPRIDTVARRADRCGRTDSFSVRCFSPAPRPTANIPDRVPDAGTLVATAHPPNAARATTAGSSISVPGPAAATAGAAAAAAVPGAADPATSAAPNVKHSSDCWVGRSTGHSVGRVRVTTRTAAAHRSMHCSPARRTLHALAMLATTHRRTLGRRPEPRSLRRRTHRRRQNRPNRPRYRRCQLSRLRHRPPRRRTPSRSCRPPCSTSRRERLRHGPCHRVSESRPTTRRKSRQRCRPSTRTSSASRSRLAIAARSEPPPSPRGPALPRAGPHPHSPSPSRLGDRCRWTLWRSSRLGSDRHGVERWAGGYRYLRCRRIGGHYRDAARRGRDGCRVSADWWNALHGVAEVGAIAHVSPNGNAGGRRGHRGFGAIARKEHRAGRAATAGKPGQAGRTRSHGPTLETHERSSQGGVVGGPRRLARAGRFRLKKPFPTRR